MSNYQLSTINYQLSIINCQLSTVNCQLSNYQLLFMEQKNENIEIIGEDDVKAAFSELLDLCAICDGVENQNRLIYAYNYAYEAHKGMRRKSGEQFIFHPIAVAKIVGKEIRLGLTSMIAALLHDVVEDVEDITIEDIEDEFGEKVAYIVNGLTKVTKVEDKHSAQLATYRKVLMSLSGDLRVVLIKISDRLHNMRTLGEMSEKNKIVKSAETIHVYAPLARKLGLNKIGRELEDLSFEYHLPDEYKNLMQVIENTQEKREAVIQDFRDKVSKKLNAAGIDYEIQVIRKSLYATWEMMNEKHLDLEDINTFQTLRLIFKPKGEKTERNQCYEVYVLVTELFNPRTGSMRDTVAKPLESGFEALTVDLMLSDGNWKEIQILSSRMSDIAERGYSSEKKIGSKEKLSVREKWLLRIKDQLVNVNQADDEFFDNFKLTLYTSEIYVYTPEGEMITLPKGASVLDFAFHIHSDLGLHCAGAKVNKKITNNLHILESGDQIEILSSQATYPAEEWLEHIVSAKAKQTLETYFRKKKKQIVIDGERIYSDTISDLKLKVDDEILNKLLKYFKCDNIEQLYVKLGKKYITPVAFSKAVKSMSSNSFLPDIIKRIINNSPSFTEIYQRSIIFDPKQDFVVDDRILNEVCVISECCLPIAGDSAIAYKISDNTIHIHSTECDESMKLKSQFKSSVTRVRWNVSTQSNFKANIFIEGIDRKNLALDITSVISRDMDVDMLSINFTADNGIYRGEISLKVSNNNILKILINKLKKINGVNSVGRNRI